MQKLTGTIAMTAALVAVIVSLWQDYGFLITMKRALLAYFSFYILGAVLVMVFKTGIEDEWIKSDLHQRELKKKKRDKEMGVMP